MNHTSNKRTHTRRIAGTAHLAFVSVVFMTSCDVSYQDCLGMVGTRDFSVRLVDDLAAPTHYAAPSEANLDMISLSPDADILPSCGGFDGLAPGIAIELTTAHFYGRQGHNCSVVDADATLPGGAFVESYAERQRWADFVIVGGATGYFMVIGPEAIVGGCSGRWVLDFEMGTLSRMNSLVDTGDWTTTELFQPGSAGGPAPVKIARRFEPAEGTICAALPPDAAACVDVFLGHFEATAP